MIQFFAYYTSSDRGFGQEAWGRSGSLSVAFVVVSLDVSGRKRIAGIAIELQTNTITNNGQ